MSLRYYWVYYRCGCTSPDTDDLGTVSASCPKHGDAIWRTYGDTASQAALDKVLLVTFPKAGKHMLKQMLEGSPYRLHPAFTFCKVGEIEWWGEWRPKAEILDRLSRVRPGFFMSTHAIYEPWLAKYLTTNGWKVIVLTRDLRDVVVSMGHFVKHHAGWGEALGLETPYEIMRAVLIGHPPDVPPIRQRWGAFEPWLRCPGILHVRYERCIQDVGAEATRVAKYLGLSAGHASRMVKSVNGPKKGGVYFRAGRVGDWRAEFDDELLRLAKREFQGLAYRW